MTDRIINDELLQNLVKDMEKKANPSGYQIVKQSDYHFYNGAKWAFEQTRALSSPVCGETSDGYHTFNELYHHRAVLFSVICNTYPDLAWKSKQHHDGSMYEGMFIVGINTPTGQATYHYDIDPYWDMFNVVELEAAPEWDGHTATEAIERIQGMGKCQ